VELMAGEADEIDAYLRRLFPLARSITGEPNRQSLRVLQELIPLEVHEIPSGTKVYDWTIPDEWRLHRAWIENSSGRRLVDFACSNLHVVSYSVAVDRWMYWAELAPHIHSHPQLPKAIPYRTSYYESNWGFCVTAAQYDELARETRPLRVLIDSELFPGSLTYGELLLPGTSTQEILISTYICHPSMANDNLSGMLLTAFLAKHLLKKSKLRWSYRFVFVPETIGSIAYSALNEQAMKKIDIGLVVATVGGPGKFSYKQSWNPLHEINRLAEASLAKLEEDFDRYPFDIHGSDERQYSSQGFQINCITVAKDRYYQYDEYHSSLDNLSFVNGSQIEKSLTIYVDLLERIESRRIFDCRIRHGEVMLSRRGIYPKRGGELLPNTNDYSELDLTLWLLRFCDGRRSLEDMSLELKVDIEVLLKIVEKLTHENLLYEI
jgi:aminopeptidase-like protein